MKPWFTWNSPTLLYILIALFIVSRLVFIRKVNKEYSFLLLLCLILYTVIDVPHIDDVKRLVEYVFRHFICASLIILLVYEERVELVRTFINIYAGFLFLSMIIYFLVLLGVPVYSYQVPINDAYYTWGFKNSLFLILPMTPSPFYRFQSVFLEPGHIGMISALVLYILKYNVKSWQGVVVLLSSLLSMSLAAYMLLLLGMLIYRFLFGNFLRNVTFLLMLLMAGTMVYKFFPDSSFSQAILMRLEYDKDKGFKGNNRTSEDFDYYYDHKFYETDHVLLGIGNEISDISGEGGNSSYKVFIVQYGILGLITLSIFFVLVAFYSKSSFIIGLFLLYAASFWQRPYALWEVELFLYTSLALIVKQNRGYSLFGKRPFSMSCFKSS